tara:strand:+ start:6559 stop:7170 length:612 start_codon:yes stop_codon:yes gene_type:complete
MSTTKKNISYNVLNAIPFADKIERKGQFDYLSWANAWDMLKKRYPDAQRTVYENVDADGRVINYFSDGRFAYVKVGITIEGLEHIDMLPVTDNRNKSIPIDQMDSMDINTTIQRSTAKSIAMHGLGIQLWSGEDVASATQPKEKPKGRVIHTLEMGDDNWDKVLLYVADNKELGLAKIVGQLKRKYKVTTEVKKEIDNQIKSK